MNTMNMRVSPTDKILLMRDCKKLYLNAHPEMKGIPISSGKMFREVVAYYLKE